MGLCHGAEFSVFSERCAGKIIPTLTVVGINRRPQEVNKHSPLLLTLVHTLCALLHSFPLGYGCPVTALLLECCCCSSVVRGKE